MGWGKIELVSDCVDGKRLRIKLDVDMWMWGGGSPSEDRFDVTVNDYQNEISKDNVTGDFVYKSIGINIFGADLSHGSVKIGNARSEKIETTGGLGVGLGGSIGGKSRITNDKYPYQWEDCVCEIK